MTDKVLGWARGERKFYFTTIETGVYHLIIERNGHRQRACSKRGMFGHVNEGVPCPHGPYKPCQRCAARAEAMGFA